MSAVRIILICLGLLISAAMVAMVLVALRERERRAAGIRRWKIDSEACFTFWFMVGTDCARCVRVCPYSHPDGLLHNLVRAGTRRSPMFRRLVLVLDDVFYGRKPEPAGFPGWMQK